MEKRLSMDSNKAKVAKEMLELEGRSNGRQKLEDFTPRWFELASQIFNFDDGFPDRKSFRIPMSTRGTFSINGKNVSLAIREVSMANLTVVIDQVDSPPLSVASRCSLQSIDIDGKSQKCDFILEVARLREFEGHRAAGMEICSENSVENLEAFYDKVYYPIYLSFLHKLAKNKED